MDVLFAIHDHALGISPVTSYSSMCFDASCLRASAKASV